MSRASWGQNATWPIIFFFDDKWPRSQLTQATEVQNPKRHKTKASLVFSDTIKDLIVNVIRPKRLWYLATQYQKTWQRSADELRELIYTNNSASASPVDYSYFLLVLLSVVIAIKIPTITWESTRLWSHIRVSYYLKLKPSLLNINLSFFFMEQGFENMNLGLSS